MSFSEHERKYFKKMFDLYDTDKSGAIGLSELKNLSRHLGVEMSEESLLQTVKNLGLPTENNDIDLEFEEFLKWLSTANGAAGDEFAALKAKITAAGSKTLNNEQIARLKEVFDHFDADKSGSIDADELINVFESMGQAVTREEMEKMIASVDDDGSGQIEFEEFMMLMCSNYGAKTLETDMQEAFSVYDPDATGKVTLSTLRQMIIDTSGGRLTEKEIADIIDSVEKRDGFVEYMKWESLWEACREEN